MSKLFDPDNQTEKTLIRKAQKLQNENTSLDFRIAVLSAVGWYMSIPVLCGIALGRFLDKRFPVEDLSWTLNFIFIGFAIGIGCVVYWVRKEGLVPFKNKNLQKEKDEKK